MSRKSLLIAETAMFAVTYIVLVLAFHSLSFYYIQVRIADALLPLSMVYGWTAIAGLTIGCAIANLYSPVPQPMLDVLLGSLTNLISTYLAYKVGRNGVLRILLGSILEAIVVTVIVGSYLSVLFNVPLEAAYAGVGLGSFISIVVIGAPLAATLSKYVRISARE